MTNKKSNQRTVFKKLKNILSFILVIVYIFVLFPVYATESQEARFIDVPEGHWAEDVIHRLRELKITNGIGNNEFGLGLTIARSEFVTYLVRLMQWELIYPEKGSFIDNTDTSKWYYSYIETALKNGAISGNEEKFRPEEPITREEMAVMIVNTLGYDSLAKEMGYLGKPFEDVEQNTGYITIAKDFGIINGVGDNLFKPCNTATREEAAAMMIRMFNKMHQYFEELNAFYAIQSVGQMDLIEKLDSVCFGWSRLEYDQENDQVILNTTRKNNNEFAFPIDFSEPIKKAKESNVIAQLMVYADNGTLISPDKEKKVPLLEYILFNSEQRIQAVNSIIEQVNDVIVENEKISFDGVVIDFESMKGEELSKSFNIFLQELKKELDKTNKKLFVAVHPRRKPGLEFYDGYDYRTIGEIADRIILMAHDYYAKSLNSKEKDNGYTLTPLSPLDEVYFALRAITDKDTGVQDLDKIWLQISFDTVQWKLKNGKVDNQYPYKPSYDAVRQRLLKGAVINYGKLSRNPYATFYDSQDETDNVLWYEDSRSVQAKIDLARMFGIKGLSLWRLGNIPNYGENGTIEIYLDVWQQILGNYTEK
ncbi:MAG TPA: hypothetical protein GXX20_08100 [Clostridiaceae bacterium]|nr:hypothetical protein [Clostridiaceae bacterium]